MKITLATLASATAQQVFDQVRDHMLRQMRRSMLQPTGTTCAYRSHDGLKCAAGALIDDSEYTSDLECNTWWGHVNEGAVPSAHASLVADLQQVHDGYIPDRWERELRALAKFHGLAWTITLATLPTASRQEVFEQAAKHLLKQNDRSLDPKGTGCAYRGRGGLACAAGALLSSADAAALTPYQNGASWRDLLEDGVVPEVHSSLVLDLQRVHDTSYPADWRERLRSLARDHGLESSFMDLLPVPYVAVSSRETDAI